MKKNAFGFTLIEIMVTLVVLIALTVMAVFTLSSYMPKHRLLDSVETLEQVLSRAQLEATSRSTWTCVTYTNFDLSASIVYRPSGTLTIYVDSDTPYHGAAASCGFGNDLMIQALPLRNNVGFAPSGNANCTNSPEATNNFTTEIWFSSSGIPNLCTAGVGCTPTSLSFVLSSLDLPSKNKAREVEALSSGLIEIPDRGTTGLMTGFGAAAGSFAGCE